MIPPKEAVRSFPHCPGVYLMKNKNDAVIYVGKAKDLKKRVSSYFLSGRDIKTSALVRHISSIDFIVTISEGDALLLENNLIKKYQPKYNISLKDGKSYPLLRITNEPFPKIFKTRNRIDDGSLYFGPYPAAGGERAVSAAPLFGQTEKTGLSVPVRAHRLVQGPVHRQCDAGRVRRVD